MQLLCQLTDLDKTSSKGIDLEGRHLFAVRQHEQVYVYENSCPHLGIQLEWQPDQFLNMDNNLIQCAMHGALFVIDSGNCIAGPCSGQKLKAVDFVIKDQAIYLAD